MRAAVPYTKLECSSTSFAKAWTSPREARATSRRSPVLTRGNHSSKLSGQSEYRPVADRCPYDQYNKLGSWRKQWAFRLLTLPSGTCPAAQRRRKATAMKKGLGPTRIPLLGERCLSAQSRDDGTTRRSSPLVRSTRPSCRLTVDSAHDRSPVPSPPLLLRL